MKGTRQYSMSGSKNKAAAAALALLMAVLLWAAAGKLLAVAEAGTDEVWVVCQPGDWVHARRGPSTRAESLGRLECGDRIRTDWKKKNGFLHVLQLGLEESEGWVYAGYIVEAEPIPMGTAGVIRANGRVACRRCVDGPRRCWAEDGSLVSIYFRAGEWTVTSKGFIRSEYVEDWRSEP